MVWRPDYCWIKTVCNIKFDIISGKQCPFHRHPYIHAHFVPETCAICTYKHNWTHKSHKVDGHECLRLYGPGQHVQYLRLGSKAKTRPRSIEDNILALKEDVTEDGETNARVGLDTTEGLSVANVGETDIFTGHGGGVVTNGNRKVREAGRRRENVATLAGVVRSSIDLLVVCIDNAVIKEKEGSTSI